MRWSNFWFALRGCLYSALLMRYISCVQRVVLIDSCAHEIGICSQAASSPQRRGPLLRPSHITRGPCGTSIRPAFKNPGRIYNGGRAPKRCGRCLAPHALTFANRLNACRIKDYPVSSVIMEAKTPRFPVFRMASLPHSNKSCLARLVYHEFSQKPVFCPSIPYPR